MDVPCLFGTWEMHLDNVLLASIVIVATPCQRFEAQHSLISSCFADTLLLIVPRGPMCKFLVVGEEFVLMRKIFWIPEYFLVFFGLVGMHIKTYFILRYARFAIKSDYLNLIFELCLRFFMLQAT